MQHLKQRRVDDEGLRIAYQLGQDGAPQRRAARARCKGSRKRLSLRRRRLSEDGHSPPHHAGEQVREEPLGLAQEGLLALHAPKLLEECDRNDLRVREALERGVALAARVEETVGLLYEAEENDDGLFSVRSRCGVWCG